MAEVAGEGPTGEGDPTEQFQPLAEKLLFDGTLEKATENMREILAKDPEWTTPKFVHAHELVTAFAVGIMRADPWFKGYALPFDFEGVVNWIAFCIQKEYPDEVPKVSLLEMEANYRRWGMEHMSFRQWNETDKVVGVTSRYSPVPDSRDFIDLDALVRNAAIFLMDEIRKNEAFDAKFEAEYGKLDAQI